MWFATANRLLAQEARRGDLTIILFAIALAVMAVYSLSGFANRIQQALESRSSSFLAADRVLQSAYPLPESLYADLLPDTGRTPDAGKPTVVAGEATAEEGSAVREAMAEEGGAAETSRPLIETARMLQFQTMAYAGDAFLLVNVKAVEGAYPLRGDLLIKSTPAAPAVVTRGPPPAGSLWLEERLLGALQVAVGEVVEIGNQRLTVAGIVAAQPDLSFSVFRAGPVVIINQADVEATGVVLPGSRLTYKVLFAGDEGPLRSLEKALKPRLEPNQEWSGIKDGDSPLAAALQRAEKFLLLASLLGVILAATAIAVAARRYTERHFDPVAVLKTLGFPRRVIRNIYAWQLLVITVLGALLGLLAGYALQEVALILVRDKLPAVMPPPSLKPLLMAVVTGVVCSLLFSFTPMLRLLGVPPLRVIRRDLEMSGRLQWLAYLLSGLCVYALIWLFSGDWLLSASLFASAVLVGAILLVCSRLLLHLGRRASLRQGTALSLALAGLYRRANSNAVQILSFSLAIMLLVTIVILREEMIAEWRQQLPEGTPNHFLINVAPEELEPVSELLAANGIRQAHLYPMVRGRLVGINDEPVTDKVSKDADVESERGRQGAGRELNLTWQEQVPSANRIIAGRWWQEPGVAEVSVESRIASRLGIELGDTLRFMIGGETLSAEVSSLREVDWNTMQPNFYMVFSPGALGGYPASYIGSFYLPAQQKPIINDLLARHPTIPVLDVVAIIRQVQAVVDQVSVALQYIMLLVVAAAVLVLFAQTQASFEERRQELVVLRTLGAGAAYIRRTIQSEFVLLGLMAGILAGWAAELTLFLVQTQVLDMPWRPHWWLWVLAGASGALFVGLAGRLACRSLLTHSALQQIRQLG